MPNPLKKRSILWLQIVQTSQLSDLSVTISHLSFSTLAQTLAKCDCGGDGFEDETVCGKMSRPAGGVRACVRGCARGALTRPLAPCPRGESRHWRG